MNAFLVIAVVLVICLDALAAFKISKCLRNIETNTRMAAENTLVAAQQNKALLESYIFQSNAMIKMLEVFTEYMKCGISQHQKEPS